MKHLSAVASPFLLSKHFKAPIAKHIHHWEYPYLLTYFYPILPTGNWKHNCFVKSVCVCVCVCVLGGVLFLVLMLPLIQGPFPLMQNEGRFFISKISVFSTHYKMLDTSYNKILSSLLLFNLIAISLKIKEFLFVTNFIKNERNFLFYYFGTHFLPPIALEELYHF